MTADSHVLRMKNFLLQSHSTRPPMTADSHVLRMKNFLLQSHSSAGGYTTSMVGHMSDTIVLIVDFLTPVLKSSNTTFSCHGLEAHLAIFLDNLSLPNFVTPTHINRAFLRSRRADTVTLRVLRGFPGVITTTTD